MARELKFEEFQKVYRETTIDSFVERVKKLPGFSNYKKAIENEEETARILNALILISSIADPELSVAFTKLSEEILCGILDSKFRAEFLKGGKE